MSKHLRKSLTLVGRVLQHLILLIFALVSFILSFKDPKSIEPISPGTQSFGKILLIAAILLDIIIALTKVTIQVITEVKDHKFKKKYPKKTTKFEQIVYTTPLDLQQEPSYLRDASASPIQMNNSKGAGATSITGNRKIRITKKRQKIIKVDPVISKFLPGPDKKDGQGTRPQLAKPHPPEFYNYF